MTDHLPECYVAHEAPAWECICRPLRMCEQRVREEERALVAVERTTLAELNDEWRKGVQAARDAVAALAPRLPMTKYEGGYDCCGCSSPDDLHDDALAAIDALRGES